MRPRAAVACVLLLSPAFLAGCGKKRPTDIDPSGSLAELRRVEPDLAEAEVEEGLDQAMEYYRRFLEEAPETRMTPEAMRRLADLKIEKQFGTPVVVARAADDAAYGPASYRGDGPADLAAPEAGRLDDDAMSDAAVSSALDDAAPRESDRDFESRTTETSGALIAGDAIRLPPGALPVDEDPTGPLEAIELYDRLLAEYPNYEHRDQVLYQKARAFDELGRTEDAIAVMEQLIGGNAHSEHFDEVQFRRGEYFFMRKKYLEAESAYGSIIDLGEHSSYYELALYKLGWTFYKQDLYEEALHRYMALLDHKVSIGYDFDGTHAEDDERRVSDTFRVISFSLNNLGGPKSVPDYFERFGHRDYEDRVYHNLGEHYLAKLRYDDAAETFRSFVSLYPYHRKAPQFAMRVVETFTKGEFPILVLEAKREFASAYGLQSEYWRRFSPEDAPEVMAFLKSNLKDLANHYHAAFQDWAEEDDDEAAKRESYREALQWYGDFLTSFPSDPDTPSMHYRLADLHLEAEDFGEAARQYERTAYDYETHEQSSAAGYAAVYAYRQQLDGAGDETAREPVKRRVVDSSLRFADTFPEHEHVAAVLGAAADDLYEMKDYASAVEAGQRVLDTYPSSDAGIRRSAWIVVAHGAFELADYARAEDAYGRALQATPEDDDSHAGFVDNLAASIYKQGERANEAEDFRAAADHFLRIRTAAPTSTIRAAAEFDAGAALLRLENWTEAASVLDAFRTTFPEHELNLEATRQIARAYRENGDLVRSAGEYERLSNESDDSAMRSEALLVAGDLYEQTDSEDEALAVYLRYAGEFPDPVEPALEARSKVAEIFKNRKDTPRYHEQLAEIVRIDAEAGPQRSARTRTLAGRSALVLAETLFERFDEIELLQPFEVSLQEKQERMNETIGAMERLVDYEIADVTAAATFYMAETYFDFSASLNDSERPADLSSGDMLDYELALEEEAYPFEEKAIELHEQNLALLQGGVFNAWTEKSLGKLVGLVPGRYSKHERGPDLAGAIDGYDYRFPGCVIEEPVVDQAEGQSPDDGAGDAGVSEDEPADDEAADSTLPEPVAANQGEVQ